MHVDLHESFTRWARMALKDPHLNGTIILALSSVLWNSPIVSVCCLRIAVDMWALYLDALQRFCSVHEFMDLRKDGMCERAPRSEQPLPVSSCMASWSGATPVAQYTFSAVTLTGLTPSE